MHELGHIAGLSRSADNGGNDAHSTESGSWTVMRLSTPRNAATGWNTDYLQECDVIELQREYDAQSYAGDYANCINELGGLTGGALASIAVHNAPSTSVACPSEVVTLSGTLKLDVEGTWGLFSGNPLTRSAILQRKPVITGAAWAKLGDANDHERQLVPNCGDDFGRTGLPAGVLGRHARRSEYVSHAASHVDHDVLTIAPTSEGT